MLITATATIPGRIDLSALERLQEDDHLEKEPFHAHIGPGEQITAADRYYRLTSIQAALNRGWITISDFNTQKPVQITNISSTYQVLTGDHTVFADASSVPVVVRLPYASINSHKILVIKKVDDSANIVVVQGATKNGIVEKIDKLSQVLLREDGDSIMIQSDGLNWRILSCCIGQIESESSYSSSSSSFGFSSLSTLSSSSSSSRSSSSSSQVIEIPDLSAFVFGDGTSNGDYLYDGSYAGYPYYSYVTNSRSIGWSISFGKYVIYDQSPPPVSPTIANVLYVADAIGPLGDYVTFSGIPPAGYVEIEGSSSSSSSLDSSSSSSSSSNGITSSSSSSVSSQSSASSSSFGYSSSSSSNSSSSSSFGESSSSSSSYSSESSSSSLGESSLSSSSLSSESSSSSTSFSSQSSESIGGESTSSSSFGYSSSSSSRDSSSSSSYEVDNKVWEDGQNAVREDGQNAIFESPTL